MIRETPHRTLKQKSRSKPKNPAPPAQTKPHVSAARSSKAESVYQFHPGHPTRLVKNDSKTKIQKIMPAATKIKPSASNKNTPDSDALYMKANLKQFISKNAASKSKGSEVVPDLLKNIDKHCKELKKINDKEQKVYEKRSSLQENKIERFQRLSGANKSQEYQQKKEKEHSKDSRSKLISQHEANRYSLQMNPQPEKKAPETHLFTNERLAKKPESTQKDTKNFMEVFQLYKKSFEIEDLKVGKSNKNTNYNTNQSKNSSSLFNSHGYSAIGDYNSKHMAKLDDRVQFGKIQSLIRSQQSSVSRENSSAKKDTSAKITPPPAMAEESKEVHLKDCNIEKEEETSPVKADSLEIHEDETFKVELNSPEQLERKWLPSKEVSLPRAAKQQNAETTKEFVLSKDSKDRSKRSSEVSKQNVCSLNQFESSKYYVKPIPTFKPKVEIVEFQEKEEEEEEDSLAGCEITLIEDNIIICEDSALMELEL